MKIAVTGAAGFIGSNLVDALLAAGHTVTGLDNLSTGDLRFLERAGESREFRLHHVDLLERGTEIARFITNHDAIIHLSANADVRFGWDHPRRDIEQNLLVTQQVLEAARIADVRRFLFSSTGSVYGEAAVIPTPEDCPFPVQTSLYGASKLAAEGLIAAYAEGAGLSGTVFRFVSIMGPRYTHGHVVDFLASLRRDPDQLIVLGDGYQKKSYLHVDDCVSAIMARLPDQPRFEVLNLGVDGYCTVRESCAWICRRAGYDPEITYGGGDRGWVGDNPFIYLDTARMRSFGWAPRHTIQQAVEATVDYLLAHPWILDARSDAVGVEQ
jgi:UDP-glucose 4-epimerase